MQDILINVLVGVISGIVASSVFFWLIFRLKPNVDISPYITTEYDDDGTPYYRFKIINRTRRSITNVQCKLVMSKDRNVPQGKIRINEDLTLKREQIFEIAPYSKKDADAHYAYRLVTYDDLETIWDDNDMAYLRLMVSATDSVSNFSRITTRSFHDKRTVLIRGSHVFGNSLDVAKYDD